MAGVQRPQPSFPEPDTGPFWEGTKQHELRYQVCDDCQGVVFFPRRHCPHCMSFHLSWRVSKGEGTVYTYTVIRQTGHRAFAGMAPYAVAWIDLDEGFRMLSNIVGVDDPATDIRIGQRVRVTWEDLPAVAGQPAAEGQDDGVSLPLFTPIQER